MGRKIPEMVFFISIFILLNLLLTACIGGGDDKEASQSQENSPFKGNTLVALEQIPWCNDKPSQFLIDHASPTVPTVITNISPKNPDALGEADGKSKTITDWSLFKDSLNFAIFLPDQLPTGSCLLSAFGVVRHAVYGSNFTITYMLPDKDALTLSQAAPHSPDHSFECSADSNQNTQVIEGTGSANSETALQICSGIREEKTMITLSARWQVKEMEHVFQTLQEDIVWIPTQK